jgi:hypothetical protein
VSKSYAECLSFLLLHRVPLLQNMFVFVLFKVMLSVILLNVVLLNVMAPIELLKNLSCQALDCMLGVNEQRLEIAPINFQSKHSKITIQLQTQIRYKSNKASLFCNLRRKTFTFKSDICGQV